MSRASSLVSQGTTQLSDSTWPATPNTPRDALGGWYRHTMNALPFADVQPGQRIRMVPEGSQRGRRMPFSEVEIGMMVRVTLPQPSDEAVCREAYVGIVTERDDGAVLITWNDLADGGPPEPKEDDGQRQPRKKLIQREWWDTGGNVWWFGDRCEGRVMEKYADRVVVRWKESEENVVSCRWWDGDGRPTLYDVRAVVQGAPIEPMTDTLTIHFVDRLSPDTNVVHPLVRWHLIDGATGMPIHADPPGDAAEAQRRQRVAAAGAGGYYTKPYDLRTGGGLRPRWEQSFAGAYEGIPDLQELSRTHPDALLLFEVIDFVYMGKQDLQRQYIHQGRRPANPLQMLQSCVGVTERGFGRGHGVSFYPICWAFLKLSGTGASGPKNQNITRTHRLQLYQPPQHRSMVKQIMLRAWPKWVYPNAAIATTGRDFRTEHRLNTAVSAKQTPPIFEVYNDPTNRLDKYPGSLYVTLHRRQKWNKRNKDKRSQRERRKADELDGRLQEVRQKCLREWSQEFQSFDPALGSVRAESDSGILEENEYDAGTTIDPQNLLTRCAANHLRYPVPPLDPLDRDGRPERHNLQATLGGGRKGCLAIAFSPCGAFIALAACEEGCVEVRVHDALFGPEPSAAPEQYQEGADEVRLAAPCIASFQGHTDTVYNLVWSPDGRMLWSASADGTARMWDFGALPPFDWSNYKTTIHLNKALLNGDLPLQKASSLCLLHPCHVYSLVVHPTGNVIVTGGFDEHLRCWSSTTGQLLRKVEAAPKSWIAAMAMEWPAESDPVDPRLFTADGGGHIRVWRFSGARNLSADGLDVHAIDGMSIGFFEGKRVSHIEATPRRRKRRAKAPEPVVNMRTHLAAQALWSRMRLPEGREPDEKLLGTVTQVTRDMVTFQIDRDELSREDLEAGDWEEVAVRKINREDWSIGFELAEENPKLFVWSAADSCCTSVDLKLHAEGDSERKLKRYRGRGFEGHALRGTVSRDGGIVCTGSALGSVFFWNARKMKGGLPVELEHDHTGREVGLGQPVFAVAYSPTDQRVAFATYGGRLNQVTIWCRAAAYPETTSAHRHSLTLPAPEEPDRLPAHTSTREGPRTTRMEEAMQRFWSTLSLNRHADALSVRQGGSSPAGSPLQLPMEAGLRSPAAIVEFWSKRRFQRERDNFKEKQKVHVTLDDLGTQVAEVVRWQHNGMCSVRLATGETREVQPITLSNPPRDADLGSSEQSLRTGRAGSLPPSELASRQPSPMMSRNPSWAGMRRPDSIRRSTVPTQPGLPGGLSSPKSEREPLRELTAGSLSQENQKQHDMYIQRLWALERLESPTIQATTSPPIDGRSPPHTPVSPVPMQTTGPQKLPTGGKKARRTKGGKKREGSPKAGAQAAWMEADPAAKKQSKKRTSRKTKKTEQV